MKCIWAHVKSAYLKVDGDEVSLFLKAPFSLMLTEITEGYSLNEAAMIIDI